MPLTLPLPEVLRRLLDQVLTGGDAVLDGPGAPSALDGAAALLAAQRCRVVRASAAGPGGLDLSGLIGQVTSQPDLAVQDGASLEQGAQALTDLDDGCDRIVLLLDGAGALPAVTLRYLQLTCRTSASLRLVLVGRPDALDGPEFGYLRARLSARPVLVPQAAAAAPQPAGASVPGLVALPTERSRPVAVVTGRVRPAAAVLGMAACLGLGMFIGQQAPAFPAGLPFVAAAPSAMLPVAALPGSAPPGSAPPGSASPGAALAATTAVPAVAVVVAAVPAAGPARAEPRTTAPAAPGPGAAPAPGAASFDATPTRTPPAPVPSTLGPPMEQPPRPAALAAELFPVPPMPPPNRAAPLYRYGGAPRRDSSMAAGRSALFPRPTAARSFARIRPSSRTYEPWTSRWDDVSSPAPGWQPPGWQSGDRNWLPPRTYPGDAYAGRNYPYGP